MPLDNVDIEERFKTERQGKPFVLYAGLIDAFHRKYHDCSRDIHTEILKFSIGENGEPEFAVVKAQVHADDGTYHWSFSGIGDATRGNVGRNIVPHLIRMAETRAKARGLRDAVNVSVAAVEELGASEEEFREVEETYRETLLANLQSEARKQGYVPQAIGRALEKWSGYSDEQLVSALDEMRNTDG